MRQFLSEARPLTGRTRRLLLLVVAQDPDTPARQGSQNTMDPPANDDPLAGGYSVARLVHFFKEQSGWSGG